MTSTSTTLQRFSARDRRSLEWIPPTSDGFRRAGQMLIVALGISLLVSAPAGWITLRDYIATESARRAAEARSHAHDLLVAAPPRETFRVDDVVHGKGLFETTCAACHKADGTGVNRLGKDLTRSWFAASLDDAQLAAFVAKGRPLNDPFNTTRVEMPPKGGHDELTGADIDAIVTYVRCLQDPRRMPPLPASALVPTIVTAPVTEEDRAKALAAAGGDTELAEYIAHGTKLFAATCSTCHGKDGKGIAKQGKDLAASDFCRQLDDDALLAFLKKGRSTGDPLNTTNIDMPPRGGNPALSDDDLLDVISFLRSLQKQASASR